MSFLKGLGKLTAGIVTLPVTAAIDCLTMGAEALTNKNGEALVVTSGKKIIDGFTEMLDDED